MVLLVPLWVGGLASADPSHRPGREVLRQRRRPEPDALLAATQRPAAVDQFTQPSGPPAWEAIPSWSLIGTSDRVITPAQQRVMSTNAGARISTVDAGHLSLITRPDTVTGVIENAAQATT